MINTGVVTTLAGTVGTSGLANGTGVAATFNNPLGLAVSGTDLYVADTSNHTIRKIVIGTGVVTTFAGTAGTFGFADGTGVAATFKNPGAIAAEGTTNLYVADTANHIIRKIVIGTAAVTTLAGTGNGTGGSTDSTGAAASFKSPGGLVVSGVNLFVADTGNNILRQIVHATGVVTTIAGTAGSIGTIDAIGTAARFQGPTGIGVSTGGTLYIADTNNHSLRSVGAAVAPTVSNPAAATVAVGANPTFTVTTTGNPTPTIQWERQAANTVGFAPISASATYRGVGTNVLTVANVSLTMSGDQFRATVTNGVGAAVSSATPATLTVQQAPTITSAASAIFSVSTAGTFTVTATGSPAPTFSITAGAFPPWASLNATTGIISGTPPNSAGAPFTFTIQASNGVNPASTQSFTLPVSGAPVITAISAPRQVVMLGQNLALSVTATSDTAPTYQWKRNGLPISGATAGTYTITRAVSSRDNGWYQVAVTNGSGTAMSAVVFVNVAIQSAQIFGWGANISGQLSIPSGLNDVISVAAGARHSVVLKTDGTLVAWGQSYGGLTAIPAGATGVVAIAAGFYHTLALKSDGTVVAWGSNLNGKSSVPSGLSNVVAIAAGGGGWNAEENTGHSLALKSDGTLVAWGTNSDSESTIPPTLADVVLIAAGAAHNLVLKSNGSLVAWGRNNHGQTVVPTGLSGVVALSACEDHNIALKTDGTVVAWGSNANGESTPPVGLLGIVMPVAGYQQSVALKLDGSLVVWGQNGFGELVNSSSQVCGIAAGSIHSLAFRDASLDVAPSIQTQPAGRAYREGESIALNVVATGGTTNLAYQWRQDGINVYGATMASLAIPSATSATAGSYTVVVSNYLGTTTSAAASLTFDPAPLVVSQPLSLVVNVGGTANFSVAATGTPAPNFQWQRRVSGGVDFADLSNSGSYAGVTSATLTVSSVTLPMTADQFRCVVSNGISPNVTSNAATLTVTQPPAFTSISGASFALGSPGSFTVSAGGAPTPTFSITTGSFPSWATLNATTGVITGTPTNITGSPFTFTIRAGNGIGSPATQTFTLSVTQPPSITSQATTTFAVNSTGTFILQATGSPAPTFSVTAGIFPTWASLNASTGVISGTPTTSTGSPFTFTIQAANGVNPVSTQAFTLNVSTPVPAGLVNLSTRLDVPASGVTAYFRVDGTATKRVLIRGIGPTLGAFGVPGAIADPRLELMDASGATIAANDDWGGSSILNNAFAAVGAFGLSADSKDAALLATLAPGFYSVRASGVNGAVGSALIEIYEADTSSRTALFTYLALRGVANSSFTTGFVLSGGSGPASVVVRAAGPALVQSGTLVDPTLQLYAGATVVASNDNWESAANVSGIVTTVANFGAIPFFAGSKDSALSATLSSRDNSIQVSSANGTGGLALVEIFDASASTVPRAPFLYSPPAPQSVLAGQTANFSVTAGGTGTLAYQWRRNGTPISGATSASYSVAAAGADAGSYDVVISNSAGSIDSVSASLGVTVPTPPTITSATGSGTIGAGFNTVFSVTATGTAPLTYQWRKDGVPITTATNSTLPLNGVTVADSGVYDVVVSNGGGSVTSVSLPLTVTPPVAPAITAQPVGGTLNIGNLASFRVTATGSPTLTYQWRKNASPIAGATSSVYVLGSATASSAGTFDVIVTNMAGALTSAAAVLIINPPVAFNAQPASVTTFVGLAVTFSAPATGFPGSPTYQWRKDGVAIGGATFSSFTLASAQLTDGGTYDVVATAAAGSATSNSATLTVSDSVPQLTSQPVGATLAVGGNTTLAVTAVGSAPLTYQWRRDGLTLAGATAATFPIANAQTYDGGLYTVVVTNALGSTTSAAARLNVVPRVVAYSARLQIDADGAVAVFTIEGTLPKKVLLRAVGPGLAPFGFSGLPDPQLELFNSTGTLLAINNDWATSADTAAISTTTAAVGAFALTIGSRDSAMIATLAPGTYTVRAKPASGPGGTGYLELYDADLATGPMSTLPYVSVRGRMGAGGGVVIGGLGSNGRGQRSYLVRAIGPTLGLPGAHANPAMLVVRDGTLVGSNDDWDANATEANATIAATARVAAFALPAGARDAALVLTGNLHASACTVQVGGSDALGGSVLLELHDLDAVRPVTFAPAIVSAPVSTTVATGEAATLRVLAHGTAPLTYQWRKDGIPLDGATTATLSLAAVQPSQGGSYTVFVTNSLGAATSLSAVLTVQSGGSGSAATQAVVGSGYAAGATATITNTLTYTATATGLGWKVTLPLGWSFVSDAGMVGDVRPVVGTVGALEWAWSVPPVGPVTFTYTVRVPAGTAGDQFLAASGIVRFDGSLSQPIATPSPLLVSQITTHSADTDADFRIGLVELTRVIELYNARIGTTRTGRYLIQDGSEDGYALDRVTPAGAPVTLTRFHSADSNRNADISLVELTRVIELYNVRAGTSRTGAYRVLAGTEDGFTLGP